MEAFWWHSKYHLPPFGIPSAPLWLHPERKLERKGIKTTTIKKRPTAAGKSEQAET